MYNKVSLVSDLADAMASKERMSEKMCKIETKEVTRTRRSYQSRFSLSLERVSETRKSLASDTSLNDDIASTKQCAIRAYFRVITPTTQPSPNGH